MKTLKYKALSGKAPRTSKILFITGSDPNVGALHHVMPALWLVKQGYDVLTICRGNPRDLVFETMFSQLHTRQIGMRGKGMWSALCWQLNLFAEVIRQRFSGECAVYYVEGSIAAPATLLALFGLPAKRVVYHTQDYLEPGRHRLWEYFERRFARRSSSVVCNEPNRARFMSSYYRLASMPHVVRTSLPRSWPLPRRDPGIRSELLSRIKKIDDGKVRLVINQSPLSDVRCSIQLLNAFQYLPDNYILVVTGMEKREEDWGEWKKIIFNLGLEQRIVPVRRIPYKNLLKYTVACDIGILLYPNDGIGNFYQAPGRLSEYISCGLPVVASKYPGLELIVLKYRLGAVANSDVPKEIANAIKELGEVSDKQMQQDRDRLRQLAKGPLAFDEQAETIHLMIQGVIGNVRKDI